MLQYHPRQKKITKVFVFRDPVLTPPSSLTFDCFAKNGLKQRLPADGATNILVQSSANLSFAL